MAVTVAKAKLLCEKGFVLVTRAGVNIPVGNFHPLETGTARYYQKNNFKVLTYKEGRGGGGVDAIQGGEGGSMPMMIYSVILQISSVLHSSTFFDNFPSIHVILRLSQKIAKSKMADSIWPT